MHCTALLWIAGLMLAGSTLSPIAAAQSAPLPDWLAGNWCNTSNASQAEERWLAPAGDLMLGLSRTVASGRKTQFEFLRIEMQTGIPTYIAQPQGRPGTTFARTDGGHNWIRFENPAHDFPQRIEYRRDGETLRAEISGPGDDGKTQSMAFGFSRCAL
ncbi:MAG: DUF6265 family protein [Pseudomarimonas sp.]